MGRTVEAPTREQTDQAKPPKQPEVDKALADQIKEIGKIGLNLGLAGIIKLFQDIEGQDTQENLNEKHTIQKRKPVPPEAVGTVTEDFSIHAARDGLDFSRGVDVPQMYEDLYHIQLRETLRFVRGTLRRREQVQSRLRGA